MKLFNIENQKKVTYLQLKNIKAILRLEEKIPKRFYKSINGIEIDFYNETHDEDFIRITDPKVCEYLESLAWIPDYRSISALTTEALKAKIAEQKEALSEIGGIYKKQLESYHPQYYRIQNQYQKANQAIKDLNAYFWNQEGIYPTPITLPVGIDSTLPHAICGEYIVGISFDREKILFGKRNRKPFTESDQVPIKLLIPMTINIGVEAGLLTDNNGSISATYSPDNIFIINSPGAKQTSASDSDAKQKETPKQKNKGNSLQMKAFPVEQ